MEDVKGACCGIRFKKRGPNDNHICMTLMIEDDEYWHETDVTLSSAWINNLINVCKKAKLAMRDHAKTDQNNSGFKFKGEQNDPSYL